MLSSLLVTILRALENPILPYWPTSVPSGFNGFHVIQAFSAPAGRGPWARIVMCPLPFRESSRSCHVFTHVAVGVVSMGSFRDYRLDVIRVCS